MGGGYTKLFSGIVLSSVWGYDDQTRIVWLTMLALADKDGTVTTSVSGLAHVARVPVDAVRRALEIFLSPDPDSSTKDDDGRRIAPIDRGWRLLNHGKFRRMMTREEKKIQDAERVAAKRASEKPTIPTVSQNVASEATEGDDGDSPASASESVSFGSTHGSGSSLPVPGASGPDPEARAIPVPGVDGGLPRAIPALPAKPHDGPKLQVWLTDAWAAARFNGFGGTGFGAGGVPADKVRDTAERLAVAPETIPHVYASMLKFWRDVKAGRHGESHLCATRPAFAWPAWSGAFSGDFEAAIGAAPQIPARAATGPPSPSKWGHARAEDQKHTKSGEVEV